MTILEEVNAALQNCPSREVSSDATFAIKGLEHLFILIQRFTHPCFKGRGLRGEFAIQETVDGVAESAIARLVEHGFEVTVFQGTPSTYRSSRNMENCRILLDECQGPLRDWEKRDEIVLIRVPFTYDYDGVVHPGNFAP